MELIKIALATLLIAGASITNAKDMVDAANNNNTRTYAHEVTKIGIQAGFASGGDTLVTAQYTDGSTTSLEAGSGLTFGIYTLIPLSTKKELSLKLAANYMIDSISASNGSIDFTRLPVDALLVKNIKKLQLGFGLTYHLNPEYDRTINYSNFNAKADNALGLIIEANYNIFKKLNVGLRYTSIEYNFENTNQKFDGSGVAITAGISF